MRNRRENTHNHNIHTYNTYTMLWKVGCKILNDFYIYYKIRAAQSNFKVSKQHFRLSPVVHVQIAKLLQYEYIEHMDTYIYIFGSNRDDYIFAETRKIRAVNELNRLHRRIFASVIEDRMYTCNTTQTSNIIL